MSTDLSKTLNHYKKKILLCSSNIENINNTNKNRLTYKVNNNNNLVDSDLYKESKKVKISVESLYINKDVRFKYKSNNNNGPFQENIYNVGNIIMKISINNEAPYSLPFYKLYEFKYDDSLSLFLDKPSENNYIEISEADCKHCRFDNINSYNNKISFQFYYKSDYLNNVCNQINDSDNKYLLNIDNKENINIALEFSTVENILDNFKKLKNDIDLNGNNFIYNPYYETIPQDDLMYDVYKAIIFNNIEGYENNPQNNLMDDVYKIIKVNSVEGHDIKLCDISLVNSVNSVLIKLSNIEISENVEFTHLDNNDKIYNGNMLTIALSPTNNLYDNANDILYTMEYNKGEKNNSKNQLDYKNSNAIFQPISVFNTGYRFTINFYGLNGVKLNVTNPKGISIKLEIYINVE
jgi:hypothetical protein